MGRDDVQARFARVEAETGAAAPLSFRAEGSCLLIRTSERRVRRSRVLRQVFGALGAVGGLALTAVSPWGWALTVLGTATAVVAPRLVKTAPLLLVDAGRCCLVTMQGGAEGVTVPLADVVRIRGAYETHGWDPRSAIYAARAGGCPDVPLLVFPGTDEPLAEFACRMLGLLLNVPATYAGPYGDPKTCYAPAEASGEG